MGALAGAVLGGGGKGGGGGFGVSSGVTDNGQSAADSSSGHNTFTIGGINLGNQSAPQSVGSTGRASAIPTTVWYVAGGIAVLGVLWYVLKK